MKVIWKRILSLALIFAFAIPLSASVNNYNPTENDAPRPSYSDVQEILNTEIVYVADIPILFTFYKYNGAFVETATLMEKSLDGNYIASPTDTLAAQPLNLPENFADMVASISNERLADNSYLFFNHLPNVVEGGIQQNSEARGRYTETGRSPTNPDTVVSHLFNYHVISSAWALGHQTVLSLYNGSVMGHNFASSNTESIRLEQVITRDGTAVAVSFPWGITVSENAASEHWSHTVSNVFMVTAHWPRNFQSSWPLAFVWNRTLATITSRVDITRRIGNTAVVDAAVVDAAVATTRVVIW